METAERSPHPAETPAARASNFLRRTSKWWHPLPGAAVRIRVKGSNHRSISDSGRGSGLSTHALFALLFFTVEQVIKAHGGTTIVVVEECLVCGKSF